MLQASIIIPTLNEADNIGPLLIRLEKVLSDVDGDIEVLFVDNNSTDGTAQEVERYAFSDKVRVYRNPVNEGLAKAVLAGVEMVDNDCIVVMDADLSHPPEAIPELLNALVDGNNDMVIGSRYTDGGATPDWPLSRKFMSKLATFPARMFCDVKDPLAGFFAVRRKFLLASKEKVKGFKLGFELLSLDEKEFKVKEVPIIFHDRECGCSKMCFKVIVDYFHQLVQTAGGDVNFASNPRFIGTTFASLILDFILCYFFLNGHMTVAAAHILGFGLSTSLLYAVTRTWHVKYSIDGAPFLQSRFTRLTLLTLFVMALRGGVIAFGTMVLGVGLWVSLAAAILVSHCLNFHGNVLFVFPGSYFRFNELINWRIFSVVAFVYLVVLRFLYLGSYELIEEEAYYWNYAQRMDIGYLDHPPMVALLIWVGTHLFGDNEFGVRIGGFLMSLLAVFFIYRLAVSSKGRSVGLAVLLLMSAFPFYYGTALFATPDAPLTAFWAGTLYFLYRVFILDKPGSWLGVSICLGFGMFSKYSLVLLGPAIILFMLLDKKSRQWFIRPHAYFTVIFSLVLFSPVIIWNIQNEWASFAFQSTTRVNAVSVFSTHELLGSILALVTPVALMGLFHFLLRGRKMAYVVENSRLWKREYLFFLLMVLAPLSVFTFFSFTKEVKFNWTGPLWLALLPYLGVLMTSLHFCDEQDRFACYFKKITPSLIAFFALVLAFLPHYLSLGLPGVPNIQTTFTGGWKDLARQVEIKVGKMKESTGTWPVVVGMDKYQIASSLSFYRTLINHEQGRDEKQRILHDTASWRLLGYHGLMYEFWFDPQDYDGRHVLMVASKKSRIGSEFVERYGVHWGAGEVEDVYVSKNGEVFGHYYMQEVKAYSNRGHE